MNQSSHRGEIVSLPYRRWLRDEFDALFSEGMNLTNTVAEYLDGPGRQESATLPHRPRAMYKTESGRLTTLLTELMSWLFVQRAIKEYEKLSEFEKRKVLPGKLLRLNVVQMAALPGDFLALAQRANELLEKILEVDAEYMQKNDAETALRASG